MRYGPTVLSLDLDLIVVQILIELSIRKGAHRGKATREVEVHDCVDYDLSKVLSLARARNVVNDIAVAAEGVAPGVCFRASAVLARESAVVINGTANLVHDRREVGLAAENENLVGAVRALGSRQVNRVRQKLSRSDRYPAVQAGYGREIALGVLVSAELPWRVAVVVYHREDLDVRRIQALALGHVIAGSRDRILERRALGPVLHLRVVVRRARDKTSFREPGG